MGQGKRIQAFKVSTVQLIQQRGRSTSQASSGLQKTKVCAAVAAAVCFSLGGIALGDSPAAATAPGGPNLLKDSEWRPMLKALGRAARVEDGVFICDNAQDGKLQNGFVQEVKLNQSEPRPVVVSCQSKAQDIGGSRDIDYTLYLDVIYADDQPLWGQVHSFRTGSHDWQRGEVTIIPSKAIKTIEVYMLLRRHTGKAMFRQPHMAELDSSTALLDGAPVRLTKPGFYIRDLAAGGQPEPIEPGKSRGLQLDVTEKDIGGAKFFTGSIRDLSGKDRAVTLIYAQHYEGTGWTWLAGPRLETPICNTEYLTGVRCEAGARGLLSQYPFAGVAQKGEGRAIAIDPDQPAFFRVGCSGSSNMLYIAYDLGLASERPAAEFRFCTFRFEARQGFRSALAAFYTIFPDAFRCRISRQGLWMPFHKISTVKGWEDFGFAFKEGNDETPWDDAHEILTFHYTEPMTWWMALPKGLARTPEVALGEAKRLAAKGDKDAQALLTSGFHDENGRFPVRIINAPWCDGGVWSMNSSPTIAGDVTHFKTKWNTGIRDKLYGPKRKGDLDGEYIDSIEGYVTDDLDFRREHFATCRTPLTFCTDTLYPAIFKGLIAFEYARTLATDMRAMGKFMMANGTPGRWCWLPPLLDVMGTETDWNANGKWQPMSDEEMMYRRAMCGPKPYCMLMNTRFEEFSHELVEKYMRRCLAYGMFPGFFSPDASSGQYFDRPELYNRDRPLFKKYVPLCKMVAEAGWRPLTGARSNDAHVYVERFGDKYLTVFNDSAHRKEVVITLDAPAPPVSQELVKYGKIDWRQGQAKLTLDAQEVLVIELK